MDQRVTVDTPDADAFLAQCKRDHKILHSLYNDMVVAYHRNFRKKTVGKILNILTMYVKIHFTAEETFMKAAGFPDFDRHMVTHTRFLAALDQLKQDFEAGKDIYERLRVLYNEESHDHIQGIDAELMAFAQSLTGKADGKG